MMRLTLCALAVVVWLGSPADAERNAGSWSDDAGVGTIARSTDGAPSSGRGAGGGGARRIRVCSATDGSGKVSYRPYHDPAYGNNALEEKATGEPGTWMMRLCGPYYDDTVWVAERRRANPVEVAQEAVEYLPLPEPAIRMNPEPEQAQLVNLPVWLWVDHSSWDLRSSSVSVEGVTVTATARPTRVIWDMGNGDQVVCNGPGKPYNPSQPEASQRTDCSYTYQRSSAGQPGEQYIVTATSEWAPTWFASGAAGGGSLPTIRRSSSTAIRVAEVQAVNVPAADSTGNGPGPL